MCAPTCKITALHTLRNTPQACRHQPAGRSGRCYTTDARRCSASPCIPPLCGATPRPIPCDHSSIPWSGAAYTSDATWHQQSAPSAALSEMWHLVYSSTLCLAPPRLSCQSTCGCKFCAAACWAAPHTHLQYHGSTAANWLLLWLCMCPAAHPRRCSFPGTRHAAGC